MKRSTTLLLAAGIAATTAAVVLNSKNHDLSRYAGSLAGQLANAQYEMGRMKTRADVQALLSLPDQPPASFFDRTVEPVPPSIGSAA